MNDAMTPGDLTTSQVAVHPFVRRLEPEDVAVLQSLARPVEFAANELIFEERGQADAFYLIRTGLVALQVPAQGVPRVIQTIGQGSILGWSWLFPPYRWQFTAVAQTPVRAIAIDAIALRDYFETDHACGYRIAVTLTETVAERLHAARHQILELGRP